MTQFLLRYTYSKNQLQPLFLPFSYRLEWLRLPFSRAVIGPGGRSALLEDVFHPHANVLFALRVREDVESLVVESLEDGIGDLPRRHPRPYQLAEGFPPFCRGRAWRLRR